MTREMLRAAGALALAALLSACDGDGGGDGGDGDAQHAQPAASLGRDVAPAPLATVSTSLLPRFDRAVVVRAASPLGAPLPATARVQPWCEDDALWLAAPQGGAPIRLRDVVFHEGAVIELGVGLFPGSGQVLEGASGSFRFRVFLDRHAGAATTGRLPDRVVLLDKRIDLQDLKPGAPFAKSLALIGPAGPADLVLRVTDEGDTTGLSPAWRDVRLVQSATPVSERVVRVARSDLLVDMRDLERDDGSTPRVTMVSDSYALVPSADGPLLRHEVPGRAAFLVERSANSRLNLRVVEDLPSVQAQGAVRFSVMVDGVEGLSIVLSGNPPMPSVPQLVPLGAGPEPARVELVSAWVDPDAAPDHPVGAVWIRPRVELLEELPRQRRGQGPNVLLVVVDTLRADHLDLYGYERKTAQHLSARAAEGLVFERAMSASSWTVPSMATLFTGQYAYTHGLYDELHWMLDPDVPTLAEAFGAQGLSTVCVMANPLLGQDNGALRGFEQVESVPLAHAAQVNRAFTDWLDAHGDERFFAVLHYFDPHDPYSAPGDGLERFLPRGWHDRAGPKLHKLFQRPVYRSLRSLPEGSGLSDLSEKNQTHVELLVDLYDAEIASWDQQFERLMAQLEERGLDDDTLVVITSDHGESFVEHGMLGHGRTLHDELLRVPLVLLNSGAAPGRRADLVGLIDLAPTLLRLAGVDPSAQGGPPHVGRDLLEPEGTRDFLFAQTSHGERVMDGGMLEMQAVITAEGKAVRVAGVEGLTLFERARDPGEQRGAAAEGSVAARLHQALDDWESASRALSGWKGGTGALDPDVEAALRALGYLK